MKPSPPDSRAPRPAAEYRWTNRKAQAFLDALAEHGTAAAAARAVGLTRQSAYRLRQRIPVVAEGRTRAQAIGRARRRGEPRKPSPSTPQGDASGEARRASGEAR